MAKLPRVKRFAALGRKITNRAARRTLGDVPPAPLGALRNAASQRTAQ
jgi:hypothetical protein